MVCPAAVGDAEQDENVGFAFFFLVEVAHHAHCQRQHHRGSRSVTDPHRQEGGNGKQHQHGNFHIAAGQAQQADGDFTVETLHVQGGCKREATEEDVNRRVGETCHRFFDVHIREAEYNGKDKDSYKAMMAQMELALKNKDLSPESVFGDSLSNTIYGHEARFAPMTLKH